MIILTDEIERYLTSCRLQRRLDAKTIKAYRIDLLQFASYITTLEFAPSRALILQYVEYLNALFKPRTVKRKFADAYYSSYVSSLVCYIVIRGECGHSLHPKNAWT